MKTIDVRQFARDWRRPTLLPNRRDALSLLAGAAVVAIAGGLPTPALAAPDYLRDHFVYLPKRGVK